MAAGKQSLFSVSLQVYPGMTASQEATLKAAVERCHRIVLSGPKGASGLALDVIPGELGGNKNAASLVNDSWSLSGLPRSATLRLRQGALAALQSQGRLADIILHEMLHCVGFGLSWGIVGMVRDTPSGPLFVGKAAISEYAALIAKAGKSEAPVGVPVEDEGIGSQKGLHWREAVFASELMSTAQPTAGNPLSRVTIASLKDLGYQVDFSEADPYSLP